MQDYTSYLSTVVKALGLDEACVKLLEEDINLTQQLHHIDQIYERISYIGTSLNVSVEAEKLIEELAERINIVVHKLKFIADNQRPAVKVVAESTLDNELEAYINTIIRTAGGRVYNEGLDTKGPQLFIFLAQNRSMFQLLGEIPGFLADEEWENTPAIKENKVFLIDGEKHLLASLPEAADDVELLAEILYPQYFVFGGEGESWMKFELS